MDLKERFEHLQAKVEQALEEAALGKEQLAEFLMGVCIGAMVHRHGTHDAACKAMHEMVDTYFAGIQKLRGDVLMFTVAQMKKTTPKPS